MNAQDQAANQAQAPAQAGGASQRTPNSVRGRVVAAGADKTITVLVERKIKHPLYKKYIRRSTKLHAHDEGNECAPGDSVVIQACRPLSKLKRWRLIEIVAKAN